jgi:hypothetical protein
MNPFISVSRRRRRRPSSVLAVAIAATFLFAALAMPALGVSPATLAARALKTARGALKLAKKADKDAKTVKIGGSRILGGAVTGSKIANGTITGVKIASGSVGRDELAKNGVTGDRIADGAIGTSKLADGTVTNVKLGDGSVGGSKIIAGSVRVKDLAGTDAIGSLDINGLSGGNCVTGAIAIAGAQPGQFPLLSFPGPVMPPANVEITALDVSAPGTVEVKACNPTNSSATATGIGIRVITLG